MKLRNNIFTALLLAIGFILHQITPGILGGMKFDFLLSFIFISLLINDTFKNAMLTALLGGLLSALTTTFPGGQIPNIIDKLFTCITLFAVIKYIRCFNLNFFIVALIGGLGTLLSGTIFLLSAVFITGTPIPVKTLIITVVIPTSLINGIGAVFIYGAIKKALKISGIIID
ncbi:tryptophan transporter [Tissierella sp. MSJ-40]|uniref:Tryptophan transporter n=1 Tax=Tissierella simiarum TaxID=2841534 RepID=A0ABS6EB77_9FIRM|nr:tryptophan transporter [Tissierella simiarum]MBU5439449.1 tryptophan transporter [Tissierella simiarum]